MAFICVAHVLHMKNQMQFTFFLKREPHTTLHVCSLDIYMHASVLFVLLWQQLKQEVFCNCRIRSVNHSPVVYFLLHLIVG